MLHLQTKAIAESGVFDNIASIENMIETICQYGKQTENYNDFVGAAYEVFCEFFFKRYGTRSNPLFGVLCLEDTSSNKYEVGIDFRYQDFSGIPAVMQVKFRSDPLYRFTRNDLATFISVCDEEDIPKNNRILFTSLEVNDAIDGKGIFHYSWPKAPTQMRVIGLNHQAEFVDRDPAFWNDFRAELAKALIAPTDFENPPPFWDHQIRMNDACQPVLKNGGRGRIICATGGGKTRVIYQNIIDGFLKHNFSVQVIVAPTIDLLRQHHAYFEMYGAFHKDGISVIHFRTGASNEDGWADISQTTNVKDAIARFSNRTLIFVTYASEEKLFEGLIKEDFEVDLVCWDEFHHTIQQNTEQYDHLQTIPSKRNLFYSASIKRGRLVSATDENIYGPLLSEVKYSELRRAGILVPKIIIKTIFIPRDKIKYLTKVMKKEAKKQNFKLDEAVIEAGGTIAAYKDMRNNKKNCTAVTFSKAVAICKAIVENSTITSEFNCLVQTVHSGTRNEDRKKIYSSIIEQSNSVLCQHSIVKEGIDINPFNCVVFSRSMNVIGTQQAIGRAVRAHPDDTKALRAGLISIDNPNGWKKYDATVYVLMQDAEADTFKEFLIEMIQKLQFAGFEPDDYEFADIVEQRHGTVEQDNSWIVPMESIQNVIDARSVREAAEAAIINLQEEEKFESKKTEFNKLPTNILLSYEY